MRTFWTWLKMSWPQFAAIVAILILFVIVNAKESNLGGRVERIEHRVTVELCSTKVSCQHLFESLLHNASPKEREELTKLVKRHVVKQTTTHSPSGPKRPSSPKHTPKHAPKGKRPPVPPASSGGQGAPATPGVEVPAPKVKLPKVKPPKLPKPEPPVKLPKGPLPEVPPITTPEVKVPPIHTPPIETPEVKVPPIKVGPVETPEVKVPKVKL